MAVEMAEQRFEVPRGQEFRCPNCKKPHTEEAPPTARPWLKWDAGPPWFFCGKIAFRWV